MVRLNRVNIKQEEDDEQYQVSHNNAHVDIQRTGDASSCQLSVRVPKHVKKVEQGNGIAKQTQPCTKVKKEEEEEAECVKLDWDGDECDCLECRVERKIKVEFSQNNATNNPQQANSCPGNPGVPSQSSVCKRVKKEEDEDGEFKDEWDEDCDCDDCRFMREKAIRFKQTNVMQNPVASGENDGKETEIDEEGNGNEDFLVGANMAVDGQIGDEDELDQEGEQNEDGQESGEDQIGDSDDETEIDDEEYEMEVDGEDSSDDDETEVDEQLEQVSDDQLPRNGSKAIDTRATFGHCSRDNSHESMVIQRGDRDANNAIGEESSATECTTNPIQPNRHWQCSHCLKSFDRKSKLQAHLRVHTGECPFQCDQCDKRFNQLGTLTRHQLIHQNIKRFRCDECGKQFSQKNHLDAHLLTHSGERSFTCRHCDKSFTTSDNRKRHEQAIHLHVKPYRCKQCAHTATQRSAVITHIRMVHFGLPKSIKQQRALNIIDHRDPRELVEKV